MKYILAVVISCALISDAYAYLDGGSSSMLLQLLLGGVAGLGVVIKIYWHKLISLFQKNNEE